MKWFSILKSKYDLKDIDLRMFANVGAQLKYFTDMYPNATNPHNMAHKQLFYVGRRLIVNILRHEKMTPKDRMIFKRVAGSPDINLEQSKIFSNISVSGSKIIKPVFPIPLDITRNELTVYNTSDPPFVKGKLNINTEGTEMIFNVLGFGFMSLKLFIPMVIKKPDREIAKLIDDIRKTHLWVQLKISTNMKYKNGTKINISDYAYEDYGTDADLFFDYEELMKVIRRDAVLAAPKKTLFEQKVEEDPKENLWETLRETYGDEME